MDFFSHFFHWLRRARPCHRTAVLLGWKDWSTIAPHSSAPRARARPSRRKPGPAALTAGGTKQLEPISARQRARSANPRTTAAPVRRGHDWRWRPDPAPVSSCLRFVICPSIEKNCFLWSVDLWSCDLWLSGDRRRLEAGGRRRVEAVGS